MHWNSISSPASAVALLLIAGCGSAVESGHDTALDSADLITMTDDMAMKITASPAVQSEFAGHGPLKVVVEPVVNQMRAEVLPRGPADAFTGRLRTLLAHHAPQEFVWIMNKAGFDDLRSQELSNVDPGPDPDEINPDFALTATFTSLVNDNGQVRTDFYECVYNLTNLHTRAVLWTGNYEVQKKAVKGFLD